MRIDMDPKEYLEQYLPNKAQAKVIEAELDEIADTLKSIKIDGMPSRDIINHPTETAAIKLIEARERYQAKLDEANAICKDIIDTINSIDDAKSIRLLHLKYCKDAPWAVIAYELHYSLDYVKKELHNKALEQFDVAAKRRALKGGMDSDI